VSPIAPTLVTLNDRLNKAHQRIRELQARETVLLAQNRTLHAVITELTDKDARTAAELCSSPLPTPSSSDGRFGIGEHASQGPAVQSPRPAKSSAPAPASGTGRSRVKRGGRRMFDLDPIGAMFLILAVLFLIAAVAYGRDDR
jgi:hypothetical protein